MPLKFTYSIAFFIFALIGIMAFDNYSGRKTKNTIYRAIMITIPIYFIISLLPRFLFFMIGDMADLGDDGIFIIIPLMTLGTVFFLFLKGLFFPGEGSQKALQMTIFPVLGITIFVAIFFSPKWQEVSRNSNHVLTKIEASTLPSPIKWFFRSILLGSPSY